MGGDFDLPAIDVVLPPLLPFAARIGTANFAAVVVPRVVLDFGRSFAGIDLRFFAGRVSVVVNLLLSDNCRIAVELGIGKQASGLSVVEDVEEVFAVIVAEAGAAANDLLELDHRIDDAGQDDVLAGGGINARSQQLGTGENDRRPGVRFHVLEFAQVPQAHVAFVRGHTADVIGVLPGKIGVQVVQLPPHFVGMFLIDTENDGLAETVRLFQEAGNTPGNCICPARSRATARSKSLVWYSSSGISCP